MKLNSVLMGSEGGGGGGGGLGGVGFEWHKVCVRMLICALVGGFCSCIRLLIEEIRYTLPFLQNYVSHTIM